MKTNKSFTLIELLIVIVIIGILASVIIVSTSSSISKAQDSKKTTTLVQLKNHLDNYFLGSTYPTQEEACNLNKSCLKNCCTDTLKQSLFLENNTNQDIYYKTDSKGKNFLVFANSAKNKDLDLYITNRYPQVKKDVGVDALVGYWSLSSKYADSQTVYDLSPYGNNGTPTDVIFTNDRNGEADGAMSFNGEDDYVKHVNVSFDDLEEHSYAVWIRWGSSIPAGYVIPFGDNSQVDSSIYFTINNYKQFLYRPDNAESIRITNSDTTILYNNFWHHVAWTVNSDRISTFYIDGLQNGDTTTLPATTMIYSAIGDGYGNYRWNGSISDVHIYNRALSEAEIKLLYLDK